MTPQELEETLLRIQSYIEAEEWPYAIEDLAKLTVFCDDTYRKQEKEKHNVD